MLFTFNGSIIKGGNRYLFNNDSTKISKLTTLKNNDIYFKYLLEFISKQTYSEKRKYLFDLTERQLTVPHQTISNNPHTILNLRKQLNLNEIKYISTIEFDEDYKNKHWIKSILSDCVNMAIMIQPEIFDNDLVLESDITNGIIPFKHIHFIYNTNFINKHHNALNMFNTKINLNIIKITINDNETKLTNIENIKNKFNNLNEVFEYIFDINESHLSCIFDFLTDIFTLKIYVYDEIKNYRDYVNKIILIHLKESQEIYILNKSVFEHYKEALLKYQTKSDYFSKIFNINSLTNVNLQLTLKNKNITCPNPDCFMIELK